VPTLSNNGLTAHEDFPVAPYEAVHERVVSKWSQDTNYPHYTAAWNALAYRFQSAADAGVKFQASLRSFGPNPGPQQRYMQEQALFNFFSNGFSAYESLFYGLFVIGSFIDPDSFPLLSQKDQQRVSPNYTANMFFKTFPDDAITDTFESLFSERSYQSWRDMRNILTHRAAPGRRMYVGLGGDDLPPVEWKLNDLPLDSDLVPNHQRELVRQLSDVIVAGVNFLDQRI
jgi:hypothetical protein